MKMLVVHRSIFWLLLSIIISLIFLIFVGPVPAIPTTLLAIYYLITGPARDKKIQEIIDEINRAEKKDGV